MAALPTSSLSDPEEILQCRAKQLFYFRLGTYFVVLRYPPVFSPAGNISCIILAAYEFSFRLEKDFGGLRYPPVLFPAGKRSSSVLPSTNSLSACEPILESCATHPCSLQPGIDPPGSCSSLAPTLFPLETDLGGLRYPPLLSQAGKRSCSLTLSTNPFSGWEPILDSSATD